MNNGIWILAGAGLVWWLTKGKAATAAPPGSTPEQDARKALYTFLAPAYKAAPGYDLAQLPAGSFAVDSSRILTDPAMPPGILLIQNSYLDQYRQMAAAAGSPSGIVGAA